MIGNPRDLTIGYERAYSNEASVARGQTRTQPQIAKQRIGGVLHDASRASVKIFFNHLRSFGLDSFVARQ